MMRPHHDFDPLCDRGFSRRTASLPSTSRPRKMRPRISASIWLHQSRFQFQAFPFTRARHRGRSRTASAPGGTRSAREKRAVIRLPTGRSRAEGFVWPFRMEMFALGPDSGRSRRAISQLTLNVRRKAGAAFPPAGSRTGRTSYFLSPGYSFSQAGSTSFAPRFVFSARSHLPRSLCDMAPFLGSFST